jgi:hypothetical protein
MDHAAKLGLDQDQSRGQQNCGSSRCLSLDNSHTLMREGEG